MNVLVFTHRAFGDDAELLDGQASPISAERHRRVIAELRAQDGVAWRDGREATRDELATVHRPHYLDFVADLAAGRRRRVSAADFALVGPTVPIHADSWSMAACAAGTVMEAVDAAVRGDGEAFCVVRPGCHHAAPDRGEGFCLFNHTAIAARHAQRRLGVERILILDVDVHHGQGTEACFADDPTVFTCSIHSYGRLYPRTGAAHDRGVGPGRGYTLNIPVEAGTRDGTYLRQLRDGLRRIAFEPGLVLLVVGMDAHADDPVGDLRLSDAGMLEVAGMLCDHVRGLGVPSVGVLAGGYNVATIGRLVAGWVRTWS